jgi:hypothetical protein
MKKYIKIIVCCLFVSGLAFSGDRLNRGPRLEFSVIGMPSIDLTVDHASKLLPDRELELEFDEDPAYGFRIGGEDPRMHLGVGFIYYETQMTEERLDTSADFRAFLVEILSFEEVDINESLGLRAELGIAGGMAEMDFGRLYEDISEPIGQLRLGVGLSTEHVRLLIGGGAFQGFDEKIDKGSFFYAELKIRF